MRGRVKRRITGLLEDRVVVAEDRRFVQMIGFDRHREKRREPRRVRPLHPRGRGAVGLQMQHGHFEERC